LPDSLTGISLTETSTASVLTGPRVWRVRVPQTGGGERPRPGETQPPYPRPRPSRLLPAPPLPHGRLDLFAGSTTKLPPVTSYLRTAVAGTAGRSCSAAASFSSPRRAAGGPAAAALRCRVRRWTSRTSWSASRTATTPSSPASRGRWPRSPRRAGSGRTTTTTGSSCPRCSRGSPPRAAPRPGSA
jgi:hypothetical protein